MRERYRLGDLVSGLPALEIRIVEGGIFLMFVVTFGDYVFKNSNPRLGFASPRMASIAQ